MYYEPEIFMFYIRLYAQKAFCLIYVVLRSPFSKHRMECKAHFIIKDSCCEVVFLLFIINEFFLLMLSFIIDQPKEIKKNKLLWKDL